MNLLAHFIDETNGAYSNFMVSGGDAGVLQQLGDPGAGGSA